MRSVRSLIYHTCSIAAVLVVFISFDWSAALTAGSHEPAELSLMQRSVKGPDTEWNEIYRRLRVMQEEKINNLEYFIQTAIKNAKDIMIAKPGDVEEERSPFLVPLRREAVPFFQDEKVAGYRNVYMGDIAMGDAAVGQKFSVYFDTGSAHVVLPSSTCTSEVCQKHRSYDVLKSSFAAPMMADGTTGPHLEHGMMDLTIRYGIGVVKGHMAVDNVCFPDIMRLGEDTSARSKGACSKVGVVMAYELSEEPFGTFGFDGIVGLGLPALSVSPPFNFLQSLTQGGNSRLLPQFGIWLTKAQMEVTPGEEPSEIAFGGYNPARLAGPLSWAPISRKQLGMWQVHITSIRVGGVEFCRDADCHGITDSGSGALGVPITMMDEWMRILTVPAAHEAEDCLLANAPDVHFEINNFTISIGAEEYMRTHAIMRDPKEWNDRHVDFSNRSDAIPVCTPRLQKTEQPPPLGPNLFILGGPVMRRYYTIFDQSGPQIGFGLSKHEPSKPAVVAHEVATPDANDIDAIYFFQVAMSPSSVFIDASEPST